MNRCSSVGLWMLLMLIGVLFSASVLAVEPDRGEELAPQEIVLGQGNEERSESSLLPIRPGAAIKMGGGYQRSVPCACFDRGVSSAEFVGRLHFGWRVALEADFRFGSMLLGGRFPAQGWALGARAAFWEPGSRWWDGFYARAGFRQWKVMGMRADGSPGGYAALNWEVQVLPHLYVEADAVVGRTFQAMQHWYFVGSLGVSSRF